MQVSLGRSAIRLEGCDGLKPGCSMPSGNENTSLQAAGLCRWCKLGTSMAFYTFYTWIPTVNFKTLHLAKDFGSLESFEIFSVCLVLLAGG